jgi:zinc transporter ZupT
MEPVLVVLGCATGAALLAAVGILPLIGRDTLPHRWLGWSNASAAGVMLGAAYVLAVRGMPGGPLALGGGAILGIAFIWWTHEVSGTGELELNRQGAEGESYGSDVLLVGALHSAAEGLAIGAAAASDLTLGLWMAAAIALHNIPEGTLLAAVLRAQGNSKGRVLVLTVVGNATLVPMAVSTFAVLVAAPQATPWALGFGSGTLIYLVTVDLLPESYRQAGATTIALVALLAMGMVATLQELVR